MSTLGFSSSISPMTSANLDQAKSSQAARILQAPKDNLAKIDKAAKDFESILLGEWLEKAEKSFASVPGVDSSQDSDPGHDQFESIGCQFLSESLSKAGGIGIASMISKHLRAIEAAKQSSQEEKTSGNLSPAIPSEVK